MHAKGVQTKVVKGSPHLNPASTDSIGYPSDTQSLPECCPPN